MGKSNGPTVFCTDSEITRTSVPVSVLLTVTIINQLWGSGWNGIQSNDTYLCASSDVVGSVHHDPQRLEREHTQVAGTHRGLETNNNVHS